MRFDNSVAYTTNEEAMSKPPIELKDVPVNFLLTCSESTLENFQLMRLAVVADLRKELTAIVDQMVDEMAKAALAAWFRNTDRDALKRALDNPEDVLEWAKEQIRNEGRKGAELLPMPPPDPEAIKKSHRIAARTYQLRNMADGKCSECPNPLAANSVKYCEEHLAKARVRQRTKKGLTDPGSREYLYAGEISEDGRGRQPGTLASLAMAREQTTRALLAELGMSPGSAAVTLNAAKEAILKCLPTMRGEALSQAQIFERGMIPTKTTGQRALKELLSAGQIERTGKGIKNDPYLYFREEEK